MNFNIGDKFYLRTNENNRLDLNGKLAEQATVIALGYGRVIFLSNIEKPNNASGILCNMLLACPEDFLNTPVWIADPNIVSYKGQRFGNGSPAYLEPYVFIIGSTKSAGKIDLNCNKCNEFVSFAEPNQPDGSFRCYGCRANSYR